MRVAGNAQHLPPLQAPICIDSAPAIPPQLPPHVQLRQQLQRKARLSYKKLQRTEGRLDRHYFAFFYIAHTQEASRGAHIERISALKQALTQFRPQYVDYNRALTSQSTNGKLLVNRPTVLVVADEIFSMTDTHLGIIARRAVPNTYAESTMLRQKAENLANPGFLNPSHVVRKASIAERIETSYKDGDVNNESVGLLAKRDELAR